MNIKRFAANNVHGYLRFAITFNADISYLDGINGSGKTSVLRAIIALLTPNILWLYETEFVSMEVLVEHDGKTFTVRATKDDKALFLAVPERRIDQKFDLVEIRQYFGVAEGAAYSSPEIAHLLGTRYEVVEFIRSLPTPMFLGLERTAQSDGDISGGPVARGGAFPTSEVAKRGGMPRGSNLDISIRQATELAREAYRQVRRERAQLTAELRNRLILAAFAQSASSRGADDKLPDTRTKNEYSRIGSTVQQALSQLGISNSDIDRHVAPFFGELTHVLANLPEGKISDILSKLSESNPKSATAVINWLNRRFQISFINNLTEAIETYNANLNIVDQEINKFTRLVNKLLNDSGKLIAFTSDSDVPIVKFGEHRTISLRDLSSG